MLILTPHGLLSLSLSPSLSAGFMFVDLFYSPDCAGDYDFYDKWALFTHIPLMILFLFFSLGFIHEETGRRMVYLAMTVFYVYLLSQAFSIWDCNELDNGTRKCVLSFSPSLTLSIHGGHGIQTNVSALLLLRL